MLSLGAVVFGQNKEEEMVTRPTVPNQNRGGAAAVGNKKPMAAAEAKNRRALGDIGNLVNVRVLEGKPQQISRPVTRSFCAQLLANAQAAAAANKNENLGKCLAHGYPFLEAEVAYCARHEYCEFAIDFIARRCRLAFLDTDVAGRALPRIIQILSAEHKWDKARQKQELQKAKEFLETFKSSKNAQFHDGKHSGS